MAAVIADLDASEHQLRALYEALAHDPDQHDALRDEIEGLQARRKLLAQDVGLAIAAWLRLGGSVDLTPPADTAEPVAEPVGAPAVAPAVASEKARTAFAGAVNANGLAALARQPLTASPLGVLRQLMSELGPPTSSKALHDLITEGERLDHVSDALRDRWVLLSRDAQVIWVAMLAARARALKSVHELPSGARDQLKVMILRLPTWAGQHRPAHIHGLAIDHDPVTGSWLDDAFELWSELEAIAAEPAAGFRPPPSPPASSPRSAVTAPPKSERELPIDASWPLWPFVRGKRALIVGGSPREERRLALEKAFAFDELEWADIDGPRRVESLA